MEINTTDPKKVYKYWTGSNPPKDIKLIRGQYWQSAHWTKEYVMYLKFKPTNIWWDEFIKQNQLKIDHEIWKMPLDAPNWFNPSIKSIKYIKPDLFDQGSRCFIDTLTGECYIYEIQL